MRDEHCHIIWGVDDGSSSKQESLEMLDAARGIGITEMICTPHMRWDTFDNALVKSRFEELRHEGEARGIKMELAYEVFYNRLMRMGLEHAPEFVQQGTNKILIEFNTGAPMEQGWERTVYDLQSKYGLKVVMAHPERYTTVLDDFEQVYRIKDAGCRIQVSAGDLLGGMFNKPAKCAKWIIKEGLCDALVTDAHCVDHYAEYEKAAKKIGW